jgi:GMP synthase-like glutamine amidotransferase
MHCLLLPGGAKRAIYRGMKLTIIQTGDVPLPLREKFGPYPRMFQDMFDRTGNSFEYEAVRAHDGVPLPDLATLDGILITGSPAGVYDDFPWLDPLRDFVRSAYAAKTPMIGICFGHQIMADALGGDVRKSEKGWGMGRHVYSVSGNRPALIGGSLPEFAIACSHQDQVITAPADADVFLSSDFTPNAGLLYRNGAAISLQPHPEFEDDYAVALAHLRKGRAPDEIIAKAIESMSRPSDSREVAGYLGAFLSR